MDVELGRIERIDPRRVWKNETADFTPWLRDNIRELGEALGLDLDPEAEREVSVGAFFADLLATDVGSGALVLVENQLEPTDHGHLGQMLTYASGLGTKVLVWIAPTLRDEHRQALTWLNENTLEDVRFFGVEIELLRIGDSPLAPNFKVVVAPSEWQKSGAAVAQKGGRSAELEQRYREFWRDVITELKARDPGFTSWSPERAPKGNECAFSVGRTGFHISLSFGWEEGQYCIRAELYIDTGDKGRNKAAFDALFADYEAIEAEMGEALIWSRRDDIRASRITMRRPGSINDAAEELVRHRDWLLERAFRIKEVFGPRVKSLVLSEPGTTEGMALGEYS